jgi:hypothetical protein
MFPSDVVIPSRTFALQAQTGLGLSRVGCILADQVENDFLQEREVLGSVVRAEGASILAETDVEHPMKAVFYVPVRTDGCRELSALKARELM